MVGADGRQADKAGVNLSTEPKSFTQKQRHNSTHSLSREPIALTPTLSQARPQQGCQAVLGRLP